MEKKVYTNKREKLIDFLIGFIVIPILFFAVFSFSTQLSRFYKFSYAIQSIMHMIVTLIMIASIIYIARIRRYIKIGVIFFLVALPLILAGTCLAVIIGISLGMGYGR